MNDTGADDVEFLASVATGVAEGLFLVDESRTRIVWANRQAEVMLGYEPGGLAGIGVREIQHPDDARLSEIHAEEDARQGASDAWSTLRRVRTADGDYRAVDVNVVNRLDDPRLCGFLVSLRESADRHRRWESERRLQALLDNGQDAVFVYDADLRTSYTNPLARLLVGRLDDTLPAQMQRLLTPGTVDAGQAAVERLLTEPATRVEVLVRLREDIGHDWVRFRGINLLDDPVVRGIILNGRLVTEEVELEAKLRSAAVSDPLTALPNRRRIMEILSHALATSSPERIAVLFLDLDRFKYLNDSFGHATGDIVLVELGSRLESGLGATGIVGRFGGDEYVVIASVDGPDEAIAMAETLSDIAMSPFTVSGLDDTNVEVFLSGSIGIALGEEGMDAATMLHHADAAMYRAKDRGRGAWALYDEGMRQASVARLTLEAGLARAMDEGRFELWYQPIVDVLTGAVDGLEALVRWRRDDGVMLPSEFISVAEETGGIHRLGAWALETAAGQVRDWRAQGVDPRFVSVNLSPRQLTRDGLAERLEELLDDVGIEPSRLCLEVTEAVLMDDFDLALKTLAELRAVGVTLALDDFGTGWSSLTYLRRAPVDVVKIDRSFIQGVGSGGDDDAIVGSVLGLCRVLDKRVVAEGVETEEQFLALRSLGCSQAQGYLFAAAIPGPDVVRWWAEHPRPLTSRRGLAP